MASNRNPSRAGKSGGQKRQYRTAISRAAFEPTIDETSSFNRSDDPSEELGISSSTARRPVALKTQIADHMKEHWVSYGIGISGFVVGLIVINLNRDVGKLEADVGNLKSETIPSLNERLKEAEKTSQSHELAIQKNELRVQAVEGQFNSVFEMVPKGSVRRVKGGN